MELDLKYTCVKYVFFQYALG